MFDEDMAAAELAKAVKEAAMALNRAVAEAQLAGLDVEFETRIWEIFGHKPGPRLDVSVKRVQVKHF